MNEEIELSLHSPISKEDWAKLADYEHENTRFVTFQTPSGRHVKYIRVDVIDKIIHELCGNYRVLLKKHT